MKVERGDVVLTRVPHAAGGRGKKRPAVVIQPDHHNQSERFVIVAEITTNLTRVADPANLLVETATHEAKTRARASPSSAGRFAGDSALMAAELGPESLPRNR